MVQWDQVSAEKNGEVGIKHAAEEFQCVLWKGHEWVWSELAGGDGVFRNVHWAPRCILQRTEEILLRALHPSGKTTSAIKRLSRYCGRSWLVKYNVRHVCFPPGVHGCFVRLHSVLFRVQECSGLSNVAHSQYFHIQSSEKICSKPGPKCAGVNPQGPIGALRYVPTLFVWLAFPTLPSQAPWWAPLPPWCCKGQWAGRGAAAAGADDTDCTTKQHRQVGKPRGMLTRNDPGRWVSWLMKNAII